MNEHRIMAMRCPKCGAIEAEPVPTCNVCGNLDMEWHEVKGEAICKSMTANIDRWHRYDGKCDRFASAIMEFTEDGSLEFLGAIPGITVENVNTYRAKLPFKVVADYINIRGQETLVWKPADFEIE